MEKKKVLVTGIGGNVGQGIIRNIRNYNINICVIGTNILDFSAGNHLVDKFYKVSYANTKQYINEIVEIVEKENIDLILPSTDLEVYYLSLNSSQIKCKTLTSSAKTTQIYLDKYQSYQHHLKNKIPFAETMKPSDYNNQFQDIILKPTIGRGSRGICINPTDLLQFSDNEYIIQKMYFGTEVTTAFYVTREGALLGFITLVRKLENGMTVETYVETKYDDKIKLILEKAILFSDFRGSANLQSIITDEGEVVPFEINCRISGTNSIRANFGFEDVKYALQEYLYNEQPSIPVIKKGIAVRIIMDVIYPDATSAFDCQDSKSKHYIY